MNIIEIIMKKRDGICLSKEEITYVINAYVKNEIADYQMSSLLMAICIKGMNKEETAYLTEAMLNSGDKLSLDLIPGIKVDKHSTGGIGDKTTLVLAPLVAALGVPVAKMSGRGLGSTGGTIDKLESISGFETAVSLDDFFKQVKEIGVVLASQTGNLVPADKKLYALRDVTGTAVSIPLIASSIMSKKLASGADKFVIDVKVGSGALMKTKEEALALAHLMVDIGSFHDKEVICILTKMDEPLGNAVGNGLEVEEAIATLQGHGPKDLVELVIELGTYMISMGKQISLDSARKEISGALQTGIGYQKLCEMVAYQKGSLTSIAKSTYQKDILSPKSGYIASVHADKIGAFVHALGAGRTRKEDPILYGVGITLHKKVGDSIKEGEVLLTIYYENESDFSSILDCFSFTEIEPSASSIIYEVVQ